MSNILFISDCHFNHSNLVTKFKNVDGTPARIDPRTNRQFESIGSHNQLIINNINSKVTTGTKLYDCGDCYFGNFVQTQEISSQIQIPVSKRRLLLGNHDKGFSFEFFKRVEYWKRCHEIPGLDYSVIFSHVPIHYPLLWNFDKDEPIINFHGHIHNARLPDAPNGAKYVNLCVEHTNYEPIHYDELASFAKKQWFKPIIKGHRV